MLIKPNPSNDNFWFSCAYMAVNNTLDNINKVFYQLSLMTYFHYHSLFRAIVFVVDSAIFQKEVRDVAEFLYILLTDNVISRNAPALVVACNKQGSTTLLLYNPFVLHFEPTL